eukprot:scaffold20192_cov26-Attheya_sp.AAC.1
MATTDFVCSDCCIQSQRLVPPPPTCPLRLWSASGSSLPLPLLVGRIKSFVPPPAGAGFGAH